MVGYFCELDGDPDSIELDKTELSESLWLSRDEIPEDIIDEATSRLDREMIEVISRFNMSSVTD